MKNLSEILLDRPIAYHRVLVSFAGVTGAVLLSQAIYWSKRLSGDRGGWFFKTRDEWTEETGLSRYEQEGARKALKSLGILEEKLEGIPAHLWFKVNFEVLQTCLLDIHQQGGGKPANWVGENQPTIYTETTTEITSFNTEKKINLNTEETMESKPFGFQKNDQTFKKDRKVKTKFMGFSKPVVTPPVAMPESLEDDLTDSRIKEMAVQLKITQDQVKLQKIAVMDWLNERGLFNKSVASTTKQWLVKALMKGELEENKSDVQIYNENNQKLIQSVLNGSFKI